MCGICGFVRFGSQSSERDGVIIEKMNRKLIHRGPDAQEVLLLENVTLGFCRLSIIGLENGMQPIYNEEETIVLICNGEIFNYRELKMELQQKGHRFRTDSDVEVIIHLYEDLGTEFLNKLNGQFAFALYDKRSGLFFCARDQMGIIPFFYTMAENTFIFGSEIKAILEHPLVCKEVDLVGLDQVFTFAGLISPRTMFRHINSLENGHYLLIDRQGKITNKEYWDLVFPEVSLQEKPERWYIDKLEEVFQSAVRLRLRSDVPIGLYLSGGLDSSMIAMKMSQLAPAGRKEAFSIDFIDSLHSESVYQKLVAREANFNLNQKIFFQDDIITRLKKSIYHSECPIKETYNTASLSLSEAVRAKGIKVILSGEGADEFFAGYVGYRFDKMRAMGAVKKDCDPAEDLFRDKLWGDAGFFYERNFLDYNIVRQKLYASRLQESFEEINCLNYPVINKQRLCNQNVLNKRTYIDYKIRLVDHLVSDHGDRMALANSVEVRYPFLDKDLIEFSTFIPAELKLNGFTEKYILKKMAGRLLPAMVTEREKFHFIAPGSPYLIQKKVDYIGDILSYDRVKRQGYFDPDQIESLKTAYGEEGFTIHAPYETDLLITVITFGIWLEEFFN